MKTALAIFIVAVAAALAAPVARRMAIERRAAAVAADLRQFAAAFQAYAHERADWPVVAAKPGQVPEGMASKLAGTNWSGTTSIGGGYRWARKTVQKGERFEAAILIVPAGGQRVSDDRDQLREIDRRVDDGDLATGRFRLGYRNLPVFVIEN